jgi:peptidoglycan/xylan/chitin deacetylase (PgdA/CDA1 family)
MATIAKDADTSCRPAKLMLGRMLAKTPWSELAGVLEKRLGLLRVFNYHGTPKRLAESFGQQIDLLLARYRAIDPYELESALRSGPPRGEALAAFTFDDGLENHFTVAAEKLEERGVRGIFCIPAAFPSVPVEEQAVWFKQRIRSRTDAEHRTNDDCRAMHWDQARELISRGHRICSHTATHEVLRPSTDRSILEREVVESKRRLEERLETTIDGFCWPVDRDSRAIEARQLVSATYRYALIADTRPLRRGHSLQDINRTRLEASWPLEAVDFQISGLMDAKFAGERFRQTVRR